MRYFFQLFTCPMREIGPRIRKMQWERKYARCAHTWTPAMQGEKFVKVCVVCNSFVPCDRKEFRRTFNVSPQKFKLQWEAKGHTLANIGGL